MRYSSLNICHFHRYCLVAQSIETIIAENTEQILSSNETGVDALINDDWFDKKAIDVIKSTINKRRIYQILSEVKSEAKLHQIFDSAQNQMDTNLLAIMIACSFENMITKFKHDCFQHNAHMNYLKLSPVLKESMNILSCKMDVIIAKHEKNRENLNGNQFLGCDRPTNELKAVMSALSTFLKCISSLQQQCMIYVEVAFINKFFIEHFFKSINFQRLAHFASICLDYIGKLCSSNNGKNVDNLTIACDCIKQIIRTQSIFNETTNFFSIDESTIFFQKLLLVLYDVIRFNLANQSFLERNQLNSIVNQLESEDELLFAKAIFLGVFIEDCFSKSNGCHGHNSGNFDNLDSFREIILSLVIATLRSDSFYFFAVTPREIIDSFDWKPSPSSTSKTITFQSVPIDCLNEIEIVEKFLKR